MSIIVPAIIPKNHADLAEKLSRFDAIGQIDTIQIDVVDGQFATPASWPYTPGGTEEFKSMLASGEHLPLAGRFKFDIDLMVTHPEKVIGSWITLGASRLTVHAESTRYLPQMIQDLRENYGYEKSFMPDFLSLGLAIGIETDLALIEPYVDSIEYVQLMGIKTIGRQGQPFDRRVLERVRMFRKRHPEIAVQIDGGVTLESAPELLAVGATRLVVGHALLEAKDLVGTYRTFSKLSERYGTYHK